MTTKLNRTNFVNWYDETYWIWFVNTYIYHGHMTPQLLRRRSSPCRQRLMMMTMLTRKTSRVRVCVRHAGLIGTFAPTRRMPVCGTAVGAGTPSIM